MTFKEKLSCYGAVTDVDMYVYIHNDGTVQLDGCFDLATLQAVVEELATLQGETCKI